MKVRVRKEAAQVVRTTVTVSPKEPPGVARTTVVVSPKESPGVVPVKVTIVHEGNDDAS